MESFCMYCEAMRPELFFCEGCSAAICEGCIDGESEMCPDCFEEALIELEEA